MHKTTAFQAATALTLLLASGVAYAQEDGAASEEETAEKAPALPPQAQNKPADAPSGLASDVVGYKFPRGIFTNADLGFFTRFLGFSDNLTGNSCVRCKYPTYLFSNPQPWIAISVGYDLPIPEKFRIGVSGLLTVGTGFVDSAAPYSRAHSASLGRTFKEEESPKDHGIFLVHPAIAFNFIPPPFERLVIEGKILAGGAFFTPSAQRYDDFLTKPQWYLATFGANMGASIGFKYMTLLTNFIVGMDFAAYSLFSPGWGTEIYLPNNVNDLVSGRICRENPFPENGIGFAPANGGACSGVDRNFTQRSVFNFPFVFATSITPVVIKYVF